MVPNLRYRDLNGFNGFGFGSGILNIFLGVQDNGVRWLVQIWPTPYQKFNRKIIGDSYTHISYEKVLKITRMSLDVDVHQNASYIQIYRCTNFAIL